MTHLMLAQAKLQDLECEIRYLAEVRAAHHSRRNLAVQKLATRYLRYLPTLRRA